MNSRRLLALIATSALCAPAAAMAQTAPAQATAAPETITVIATSPLQGTGVDKDSVPGETTVLGTADIARKGTPDVTGSLNDEVSGITLDSASGNPYQPSLYYHGFQASPLQGTGQGLAVYMNGVRFNQPFGDTVNWDLIPDIAISKLDLQGANPVFGLNALGGALSAQLKNGFTYQGAEADLSGGSFSQVQSEFQYGSHSDNVSFYVAGSEQHEAGWRDLQSSDIQNLYSDLGWRGDKAELHLGVTMANSSLNGPGTAPVQLLSADPAAQFTAPNSIANKYIAVTLNGSYQLSDEISLQALAYYQYLQQRVVNGNSPNDTPCDDGSGFLCSSPGVYSTTRNGQPIPAFLGNGPYSELDEQTTNTNSYGTSVQLTDTGELFGFKNHLVVGSSFDGADTEFSAVSLIGGLTPDTRVFTGPGIVIDEPGNNTPVRVAVTDAYASVFATDSFTVTPKLTLTLSGRFNNAEIDLNDQDGGDLTGQHSYNRFNPATGLTYKLTKFMTLYAGYSEANRAPTPAELSCAGPYESCSLANFFVGDPNLKQVIAHTIEAGTRGAFHLNDETRLSYDLAYFHTDLDDDIAFINAPVLNRAYFQNIGQTRRQGFDANIGVSTDNIHAFLGYTYTDATYQSGYTESAGSNPDADGNGDIVIRPGDRMPGIPANQAKAGVTYDVTDDVSVGLNAIYQSGEYLFGDEANLTPRMKGYATVNFETSYQLTPKIQIFGRIENLTDTKYYTYGTFSPTSSVYLSQAPGAMNPRSYSLAAPIGGFAGVRVNF